MKLLLNVVLTMKKATYRVFLFRASSIKKKKKQTKKKTKNQKTHIS